MLVEPASHLNRQILDAIKDEYALAAPRGGMHVSDLTHCLTKSYWARIDPAPPNDKEIILWAVGFGLERVLIPRLHVEPLTIDGITGTPDFAFPDGTPADLKSSRMAVESSAGCGICGEPYKGHTKTTHGHAYEKAPPVQFQIPETWRRQFMAYCHMVNSRTFGLVVVHLIPAEIRCYTLHFTEGELAAHWQWMVDRKGMLESMHEQNNPRPFESNEPWECEHCPHSLKCALHVSIEGLR